MAESAVPILPSRDVGETPASGAPCDEATGSRLDPPVDTDYGIRELALVDPSGNRVRVGSPLVTR
jgi:hypothetical protein